MRFLLSFLSYLLLPLIFFAMLWRGFRSPEYWERMSERFGRYSFAKLTSSIWVHAVSVGEVQAAIPLVKRLQDQYPEHSIVFTTQTPTGSQRVKEVFSDSVVHCYVPYDVPLIVRRFLRQIKPKITIIMETEIWPNIYAACFDAGVPIVVASARISPRSIASYERFKKLFHNTLQRVELIAAQTSRDAQRFISLGAPIDRVKVIGNLKFDFIFVPSNLQEKGKEFHQLNFADRPIWIAASTHEPEENLVLEIHQKLLNEFPHLGLILVPRHPERFQHVENLIKKFGLKYAVRSRGLSPENVPQVLLVDTLGELPMFYAASNIAFVGGSMVTVGGHNLLEPAALSIPIIVGPHTFNAPEISEMLEEVGALEVIHTPDELKRAIERLLNDTGLAKLAGKAGKEVVAENYGALDNLLQEIRSILSREHV